MLASVSHVRFRSGRFLEHSKRGLREVTRLLMGLGFGFSLGFRHDGTMPRINEYETA